MKILTRNKKLLTNGEFLEIISESTTKLTRTKAKLVDFCSNSLDSQKCTLLREKLRDYGLTEFEAVNLINLKPKGLVHLQIGIEEMVDRLSEVQMNEILLLFSA